MFEVQLHLYNEKTDDFDPRGEKVPFLTFEQAKNSAKEANNSNGEYYLITKIDDDTFKVWHDDIW